MSLRTRRSGSGPGVMTRPARHDEIDAELRRERELVEADAAAELAAALADSDTASELLADHAEDELSETHAAHGIGRRRLLLGLLGLVAVALSSAKLARRRR